MTAIIRVSIAAIVAMMMLTQVYIITHLPRVIHVQGAPVVAAPVQEITATVTAYTARPCETNDDPMHTATMERPKAGWTCAVSRDLMHWLGGRVYIDGLGVRRVNDLMNERFEQRIDVFCGTVKEARAFGKQTRNAVFLGR